SFGGKCTNKRRGEDQPHPSANQIGGQFRQSLIGVKAPPIFNRHIAALGESTFAQAFAECCSKRRRRFGCTRAKVTNHWQLFRARRAQGGQRDRRAAQDRDELAPSHAKPHPSQLQWISFTFGGAEARLSRMYITVRSGRSASYFTSRGARPLLA